MIPASQEMKFRRMPQQKRAQTRVKRILEVTGEMLDQVGFEKTSTNHIAQKAQTNISSVYQYFPNKQAIVLALSENLLDQFVNVFSRFPEDFVAADDWWGVLLDAIKQSISIATEQPGARGLRRMLVTLPGRRLIDTDRQKQIEEAISQGFSLRRQDLSRKRCQLMARLIVKTVLTLFEHDTKGNILAGSDAERNTEIFSMCYAYLSQYFGTMEGGSSTFDCSGRKLS